MFYHDQREKLMETVSSIFHGKLKILVNNVGTVVAKEAVDFIEEDISIILGAINQLPRSLACEWAKDKIRVDAIAPRLTRTSLISSMMVYIDHLCFIISLFFPLTHKCYVLLIEITVTFKS